MAPAAAAARTDPLIAPATTPTDRHLVTRLDDMKYSRPAPPPHL